MSLGTVLLGVLSEGPAHGYDLKRVHDERFPAGRRLAYGQVYATLSRLLRDGQVEEVETVRDGGPDRTVYAITEAGRDELARWLTTPEEPGPFAADELVRKTITALHTGGDAAAYLDRQRAVHLDAMRALTRTRRASPDLGERIALDHSLAHLDADLRWLEETREQVAHRAATSPTTSPTTRPTTSEVTA